MRVRTPNSQYNLASPNGLAARLMSFQRRVIYERFLRTSGVRPDETILDVGVTTDRTYESSNYLEAWYPHKEAITASGLDDASFLEIAYPGVKFVRANGLHLPFADRSFDIVHASAVIEHVGSAANQARLVRECARVARRFVFLTTPNRWFPVEFHTLLPLLHWLPRRTYRRCLRAAGLEFFAEEANLNLLGANDLAAAGGVVDQFDLGVIRIPLFGWTSNLALAGGRCGNRGASCS